MHFSKGRNDDRVLRRKSPWSSGIKEGEIEFSQKLKLNVHSLTHLWLSFNFQNGKIHISLRKWWNLAENGGYVAPTAA